MKRTGLVLLFCVTLCLPVLVQAQRLKSGSMVVVGTVNYCTDAGSTDAYACNLLETISAYGTGTVYAFQANTANTGAATLALNGLSPIPIMKLSGGMTTALADNDIRAGQIVVVYYDGTNLQMVSQLGNAPAGSVSDGDKGDVTVSGTGTTWTLDNEVVTYAKLQNVTATDRFLGRDTAGAGDVEEIAPAAAKTMLAMACSDLTDDGSGCSSTVGAGTAGQSTYYTGTQALGPSSGLTLSATALEATRLRRTAVSATGTLGTSDGPVIECTAGSEVTLTLPTAVSGAQSWFRVPKVDSGPGACVVAPASGERINGTVNGTLSAVRQWEAVEVYVSNTATPNWHGVVSVTQVGTAQLADAAVTYAKLQNVTATDRLLGRDTAGAGVVEEITPTAAKALLAIACADLTDEGAGCSMSTTAGGDLTGTLPSPTIAANAVTLAKMATMATDSFLGRDTAGTGNVEVLSVATTKTVLALNNVDNTSDATKNSATATLTGKTYDAEGTGNVLTIPQRIWLPAAGCANVTAGSVWDLPTTNAAVPACVTGTNTQKGVLDFADGSNLSAQITHMLPSTWTGAVDVVVKWFSSTAAGNVVWQTQTSCVANAELDDPSWNTADVFTADAAHGTPNQINDAVDTNITMTGCAAGELLHLKLLRDSAHASDTMAGTARLIGVELTLREAL